MSDPSLLRFLVDLRDADPSDKQLRDDLMTMLIAGHETTAAVLTWTLFCLMQHPQAAARCVAEVDAAIGRGDNLPSTPRHWAAECKSGQPNAQLGMTITEPCIAQPRKGTPCCAS